jgi:anti-sigma factor (TIGR02949 family)
MSPDALRTMDCAEIERSLDAFLDGEFDAQEVSEAEAHLAACPRCRGVVEVQARLRAAIKAKLREAMAGLAPEGRAPQHLRARVEQAIARERRPLWRRALAPLPLATLAACAAGALVVLVIREVPNELLVQDAISYHHRSLPLEVDAASMVPWFSGKLPFRPAPPHLEAGGAAAEGARLSNLREWPAAYIRYRLPQGQAGLFIVDDPDGRFAAPGREVKLGPSVVRVVNARGYNVAVWRKDEIVYSLVSDLDESALFQLVRTAQADVGR